MRSLIHSVFILSALLTLSSCLKTRSEVEAAESQQDMQNNVNQLQQKTADQEVRFQDIDSEFRNLSGRIEVVEQKLNLSNEGSESYKETVEQRISKLEQDNKALQEALSKFETQLAQLDARTKSKPVTTKKKKKLGNYTGAEKAFKEKRWKDAIFGYEKYLELNPKGKRADMATYKIGVAFQELKMSSEAKTFYQLAVDKFPKSEGAKRAAYRLKNIK